MFSKHPKKWTQSIIFLTFPLPQGDLDYFEFGKIKNSMTPWPNLGEIWNWENYQFWESIGKETLKNESKSLWNTNFLVSVTSIISGPGGSYFLNPASFPKNLSKSLLGLLCNLSWSESSDMIWQKPCWHHYFSKRRLFEKIMDSFRRLWCFLLEPCKWNFTIIANQSPFLLLPSQKKGGGGQTN